jgi:hypothetical protein
MRSRAGRLCTAIALLAVSGPAAAADEARSIVVRGADQAILRTFTYDQLRTAFPQREMETVTPWSKGGAALRYRGPAMLDILARSGLPELQTIEFGAYDGFRAYVRTAEIRTYEPILALQIACSPKVIAQNDCSEPGDFRPLTLEEHGPFLLMWPLAKMPDYYSPQRNSIWVWFMTSMQPPG